MKVKKRPFQIFKDKSGYYIKIDTKKIKIEGIKDDKKFINIIIKKTINKAEKKKTRRKRKIQNKKIHELESSGFSGTIKDLFNDKVTKKILKLKDLEINERLLKAITPNLLGAPPQRLALPLPPRPAIPPSPPRQVIQPPPFNILASPSSQILTAAQTHLRPVPKGYI